MVRKKKGASQKEKRDTEETRVEIQRMVRKEGQVKHIRDSIWNVRIVRKKCKKNCFVSAWIRYRTQRILLLNIKKEDLVKHLNADHMTCTLLLKWWNHAPDEYKLLAEVCMCEIRQAFRIGVWKWNKTKRWDFVL